MIRVIITEDCQICDLLLHLMRELKIEFIVETYDPAKHEKYIKKCKGFPIIVYGKKVICGLDFSELEALAEELERGEKND